MELDEGNELLDAVEEAMRPEWYLKYFRQMRDDGRTRRVVLAPLQELIGLSELTGHRRLS
jgi:hypothetical protein